MVELKGKAIDNPSKNCKKKILAFDFVPAGRHALSVVNLPPTTLHPATKTNPFDNRVADTLGLKPSPSPTCAACRSIPVSPGRPVPDSPSKVWSAAPTTPASTLPSFWPQSPALPPRSAPSPNSLPLVCLPPGPTPLSAVLPERPVPPLSPPLVPLLSDVTHPLLASHAAPASTLGHVSIELGPLAVLIPASLLPSDLPVLPAPSSTPSRLARV
ncbi:hypothetical protein PtB15_17B123 [Puccinia triticina]|nr:hypothetical protein PtB15_17B123 [Puccinia triticina]